MQVNGPLRILGMIANPGTAEWPRLDEPAERRRIAEGIDKLQRDRRVIFEWVPGGTASDLLSKLMEDEWHIFHFIGHGGVEQRSNELRDDRGPEDRGFIVFTDEYGQPVKKFASDLAVLLTTPNASLRLAVLNCCESGKLSIRDQFESPAIALIRSGLPAVVAMQFPIRDKAAIRLAEGFYKSLANNLPVDTAVTMARKFIQTDSNIDWAIPVLYMRKNGGRIFELGKRSDESAPRGLEHLEETRLRDANQEGERTHPRWTLTGQDFYDDVKTSGPSDAPDEQLTQFMSLIHADQKTNADLQKLVLLGRGLLDKRQNDNGLAILVAKTYYELGRMQLGQSDVPKAAASLSCAIDLDPTQAEYRIRRSNLFARAGLYERALADVTEAIKINANIAEYHWIKGIVHSMIATSVDNPSVLQDAIAAFSLAIKLNELQPKYLKSRVNALVQTGRYVEALADIDRALLLDPRDEELKGLRAKIAIRVGAGSSNRGRA